MLRVWGLGLGGLGVKGFGFRLLNPKTQTLKDLRVRARV